MPKGRKKIHTEASGKLSEELVPLEVLSLGIYNEISAYDFYIRVSQSIANPSGQEKFRFLASDEKRHREILEKWYEKESGQKFRVDSSQVKKIDVKIKDTTSAFEAIDIAMEAERQAYLFYTDAAGKTKNEDAKKMLQALAKEEDGHYLKLSAERNALSGGFYWFDIEGSGFVED